MRVASPAAPPESNVIPSRRARMGAALRRYQGVLGLAILFILASFPLGFYIGHTRLSLYSPYFRSWDNFANIFRQTSITGILAVGMTFVILTAGIELSVGSGIAFLSCVAALLAIRPGVPFVVAIAITLALGAAVGGVDGILASKCRFQPFIATLAAMVTLRGLAYRITGSNIVNAPILETRFRIFSGNVHIPIPPFLWSIAGTSQTWNPVPVFAIFFLFCVVAGQIILTKTRFGRYVMSVGGNEEATRLSGVRVDLIKTLVYTLNGILVALAALMFTARTYTGDPGSGIGFELDAIAAVVVGGTSLFGGKGSVIGALIGALFIGTLNNVLQLNYIDRYTALALEGPIILLAVALQRGKQRS